MTRNTPARWLNSKLKKLRDRRYQATELIGMAAVAIGAAGLATNPWTGVLVGGAELVIWSNLADPGSSS